jgi:hypothetical protein
MERCTHFDQDIRCTNTTKNNNKFCKHHSSLPNLNREVMRECHRCLRLYYKLRWFDCRHGFCDSCIQSFDSFKCTVCQSCIYNVLNDKQKRRVYFNQILRRGTTGISYDLLAIYNRLEEMTKEIFDGYDRASFIHHQMVELLGWDGCVRPEVESTQDIIASTELCSMISGHLTLNLRMISEYHPILNIAYPNTEPTIGNRLGVYLMAEQHNIVTYYPSLIDVPPELF